MVAVIIWTTWSCSTTTAIGRNIANTAVTKRAASRNRRSSSLQPHAGKLARPGLRGRGASGALLLPDLTPPTPLVVFPWSVWIDGRSGMLDSSFAGSRLTEHAFFSAHATIHVKIPPTSSEHIFDDLA